MTTITTATHDPDTRTADALEFLETFCEDAAMAPAIGASWIHHINFDAEAQTGTLLIETPDGDGVIDVELTPEALTAALDSWSADILRAAADAPAGGVSRYALSFATDIRTREIFKSLLDSNYDYDAMIAQQVMQHLAFGRVELA